MGGGDKKGFLHLRITVESKAKNVNNKIAFYCGVFFFPQQPTPGVAKF